MNARLEIVAQHIFSETHIDVGSDYADLLAALLKNGQIKKGIAVENKRQPFENSLRALSKLNAEVRFGNGLSVVEPDEADSLSICGLSAKTIVEILATYPERIPEQLVLQPNRQAKFVRLWALKSGYDLVDEQLVCDNSRYTVLAYRRKPESATEASDPAYFGLEFNAAVEFGPMILKHRSTGFLDRLRVECKYLTRVERLNSVTLSRLKLIRNVLGET